MNEQDIANVAGKFNIPPAILRGLVEHAGGSLLQSPTTYAAYDLTPKDVQGNEALQLEIVARQLQQSHTETGSWESAISQFVAGDPKAFESPTSQVGGIVNSVLGIAATDPMYGMDTYLPADSNSWGATSASFTKHLKAIAGAGGVVTQQHIQQWSAMAGHAYVAGAHRQQAAYAPPTSARADAMPFDPRFDTVEQGFMPGAGNLEPGHTGVDYAVPDHSPLYSVGKGTVRINQDWSMPGGPQGYAVSVVTDDGFTYLYGHVQQFTVKDGQKVGPGQQIALSGGAAGDPGQGFSTGAHLHFEVHGPDGRLIDPTTIVQAAAEGATPRLTGMAALNADRNARLAELPKKPPTPDEVGQFAGQLKAAGIDPDHFASNYSDVASMRRRLMAKNTTIDDYAPMSQMDPAAMQQYIRAQPHAVYPNVNVGQFADTAGVATLHSLTHVGRTPYPEEIAHLVTANADWREMKDYYQGLGQSDKEKKPAQAPQQGTPTPIGQDDKRRQGGAK